MNDFLDNLFQSNLRKSIKIKGVGGQLKLLILKEVAIIGGGILGIAIG